MPTLLANAYLDRPSVVWCWDWWLDSSFPITFPFTFGVAPFRFSTLDCYPGGVLGDVLYEARLLEKPQLALGSSDSFGGLEQVDQAKMRLMATSVFRWRVFIDTGGVGGFDPSGFDPSGFDTVGGVFTGTVSLALGTDLHTWVTNEHRGKLLIGHLVELDPKTFRAVTIQQNAFIGETVALADDPGTVSLLARALDLASMTEIVPATLIDTSWAAYAPPASLGRPVPLGIGIGRRIPCLAVKGQTEEPTLFQQPFTAVAATDLLTIMDHNLDTGAGPFRLSTTGTLPGGLTNAIEYWVVVVDDTELRLATTLGNALTNVTVDITDAGAGTHTMTGGLAPNLDEDFDCIVGHGNCGIVRVWEDEAAQGSQADAMPDVPVTYAVEHKRYRPGGRYATSLRFQEQLDGVAISADLLRVYPDVDDAVVAEWKWLTGFGDDIGGFDAVSSPDAAAVTLTSDLVPTHQRYGLGGVALDGTKWLDVLTGGAALATQAFCIECEAIPASTSTGIQGGLADLASGGGAVAAGYAWVLVYNEALERIDAAIYFQDGTTWTVSSTNGSAPRGRPFRVLLQRNGSGTSTLVLGRTVIGTDTRTTATLYAGSSTVRLRFGARIATGPTAGPFRGVLGWRRYSNQARSQAYIDAAYYLWRRNPIQLARELATDARRLVNEASFAAAAAAIDAVQGGTLYADGWLVDENELRAALDALVPFRDLQFSIGTDTRLAVDVAAAPTVIQGQFGHGDDYANLLQLPTRTRASLTEAPRSIAVRFRRARTTIPGPFAGYAMQITRPVLGVGKDAAPLELPFVDHPVTADQIADFRAKRMRTRDSIIDVVLGHEGRTVTRGGAIRLNVPAMSIVDQDLEAVQLAKGAEQVSLRGVPINAADFTYTPQPLPADPADRTLQVTDLGNTQSLQATLQGGRLVLQVNLLGVFTLRPIGASTRWPNGFPVLVGAPVFWQAIDEVVADDATSYIEANSPTQVSGCIFEPIDIPAGPFRIASLELHVRMQATGSTVMAYTAIRAETATSIGSADAPFWTIPTGGWTDVVFTAPSSFLPGPDVRPWTLTDVNAMQAAFAPVSVPSGATLQITQVYLVVNQVLELPLPAGFVQYWIRGPSATTPAAPLEAEPAQFTALDLTAIALDLPNPALGLVGTTGDTFWIWAGVYDEFGRRLVLVGPQSVTLP